MNNPVDKAFKSLSIEEIATMVKEFNNETISLESLIRKVASEVFNTSIDKTSITQMQLIVVHCALCMSRHILSESDK